MTATEGLWTAKNLSGGSARTSSSTPLPEKDRHRRFERQYVVDKVIQPAGRYMFPSLMLDSVGELDGGTVDTKVDFIARDLVAVHRRPGTGFLVMEGWRPVADALITEAFTSGLGLG
jgi:hypothetical protein